MGAAWTAWTTQFPPSRLQSLAVGLVRSRPGPRPRTPFDVCSGVLVPASRLSLDTRAALSLLSVPALAPALGELARVLVCKERYPRFARLAVELRERTSLVCKDGGEYDVGVRVGAARPFFRAFADAGVAVDVVVRPYEI